MVILQSNFEISFIIFHQKGFENQKKKKKTVYMYKEVIVFDMTS